KFLAAKMSLDDFHFSEDVGPAKFKFALPLQVLHRFDDFHVDVRYGADEYGNECFVVTHFPGSGPMEDAQYLFQWASVVERFEYWVDKLKTELSQPDPWLLLNQGTILQYAIPPDGKALEKF